MQNKVCAGLIATVAGGYLLRRQGLRWGATDEEVNKPLPGDEVVPHPMLETNHAVSIAASAEEIWPWLVQRATTEPVSMLTLPGGTNTRISTSDPSAVRRPRSQATASERFRVTNGSSLSIKVSRSGTPSSTVLPARPSSRCATWKGTGHSSCTPIRTCASLCRDLFERIPGTASMGSSPGGSSWRRRGRGRRG